MSREFGEYGCSGYFHQKLGAVVEDARSGKDPLTKLWGEFLESIQPVAYAIASSEARDAGPDFTIFQTIESFNEINRRLEAIRSFVEPYRRVAEEAVRSSLRNSKKETK